MMFQFLIKWFFWLCLLAVLYNESYAQKGDYVWLSGYESYSLPDSGGDALFGNTILNFGQIPLGIGYDSLYMNFDRTNSSYCDTDGNLLFYSNGISIANSYNEKIENSDSLNAGWLQYDWDNTIQTLGYRDNQGLLCFQSLSNKNQYFLIHSFTDSLPGSDGTNIICSDILCTLLDMSQNNGHGKVVYKNRSIIHDTLGNELSATRHGNGRDWWILVQKRNTNCYYEILMDTGGLKLQTQTICGSYPTLFGDIGASCFSPDGTKYFYLNTEFGISVFDFDRCTGVISSSTSIPLTVLKDSSWLGIGIAVSPNNRFLYVSATKILYQYDLWASDITNSVLIVGQYSDYQSPFDSYFTTAQLAPDGKIYISCGNSDSVYHIISNPDILGLGCNFIQHGLHLRSVSLGVPNFPNYRLGALNQSQCDSLTSLNEVQRDIKEKLINLYPNPAGDYIVVDYGFTDWSKGNVSMEIIDDIGQVFYQQQLPLYSGFQKIDVSKFASGFYTVFIKRQNMLIATAKFVKQ